MRLYKHLAPTLALAGALAAGSPAHLLASASLDAVSPSVTVCGASAAHFYRNTGGVPGGCDVGPGPVVDVLAGSYGAVFADDTDGASNNEADPTRNHLLLFSVDRGALGVGGSPVNVQAGRFQAAGDVFRSLAAPSVTPAGMFPCGGAAILAPPGHALQTNQHLHNFIPTIGPGGINGYGAVDDLDALEIGDFDTNKDGIRDRPVYFTLARFSPSLGVNTPADIFLAPPGAAFFVFAPQAALGLQVGDNVDALAVWDKGVPGQMEAGIDYAIFSLDPNSPTLAGPDGIWGTFDDFSPGDVFVTDFSGIFCLYVNAGGLGLLFNDNLDALDVLVLP